MPAKRRAAKRKAPEPKVEEPVEEVAPEPVAAPEPVVEQHEDQEVEDVEEDEVVDTKKELTDEEKIAELDKLSKAHPFGLLANLAKLSNKHRAVFQITKNEKTEGAEASMSLVARFGEVKITVNNVPGENFKFAKKIGSDLILSELYQDKHEVDAETEHIRALNPDLEVAMDAEWYKEKKAEYATSCSERVDRIIKRIQKNDRYDEEAKAKKIGKFESWRSCTEDLLDYDEVYKVFDHPYFRVMHNALSFPKSNGLKYKTQLFKFDGETAIEIPTAGKGGKRTQEEKDASAESEQLTKFKVCITIFKADKPILELEHTDETDKLKEAKSEAAYKVLEKLLLDKVIDRTTRRDLKNKNDRMNGPHGRRGNNQNRQGGRNQNNRNKNNKNKKQNPNQNQNQNKKGGNKNNQNKNQNKNQQKAANGQMQQQPQQQMPMMGYPQMPMGGGMNGHQQMMMMPVMMGPNGQMMIASNAQPMMMPQQQQMPQTQTQPAMRNNGPSPAKKKKRNFNKKKPQAAK